MHKPMNEPGVSASTPTPPQPPGASPTPTIKKAARGWLALSPEGDCIQIGVPGDSPEDAATSFAERYVAWVQLHGRRLADEDES